MKKMLYTKKTLNLFLCADKIPLPKKGEKKQRKKMVQCHVSFVRCHMFHVTNANSHSHKPSPCCRMVHKNLKNLLFFCITISNSEVFSFSYFFCNEYFCNWSFWSSAFVYGSNILFSGSTYVTDIASLRLNWQSSQFSDNYYNCTVSHFI